MGTACLVTGSEALWGECGYYLCNLNIQHISMHWTNMYATILNNHHKKDIDKQNPDMFTHFKRVHAKITSAELKLVLCCHLVDGGGDKSVLMQNAIYIYICAMILTDEITVCLSLDYDQLFVTEHTIYIEMFKLATKRFA